MTKDRLIFILITLILASVWTASYFYHKQASEFSILPNLEQALETVETNFDQDTLSKLGSRQELPKISPTPITSPSPTPRGTATRSGSLKSNIAGASTPSNTINR